MPEIDLRHIEKKFLFSLYEAKFRGNIDTHIACLEASMEPDDVARVKLVFEGLKTNNKK